MSTFSAQWNPQNTVYSDDLNYNATSVAFDVDIFVEAVERDLIMTSETEVVEGGSYS